MTPVWHAPETLDEALALRAQLGEDATVVAGGTFVGILIAQGLLAPAALLSLRRVPDLSAVTVEDGTLRLGAMVTHRAVERSTLIKERWPVLARAFALVANTRVRTVATVGGVLADADYASDPPALFCALGARMVVRGPHGDRSIDAEDFITGMYQTALAPDELLLEVRVPGAVERAAYRKFTTRSAEDRPCVSVGAARVGGRLRVAVGAVADRPQYFPAICALADGAPLDGAMAAEIGRRYAEAIDPIGDLRGSAAYRRRVIAVEVRRALEELAA